MTDLEGSIDRIASETGFSGVVRVDRGERRPGRQGLRFAHRGFGVANTVDTRFGIASGTKGFTALTVMSLIEEGRLSLTTTARSVLGGDLPLIDDGVTVEHLLAHRSGIGDYFDEDLEPTDHRPRLARSRSMSSADDRESPAGARRLPNQVPARRALLVLQRRLRRPRADRRAHLRRAVPRAGRRSGCASPPGWRTRRSCAPTSSRAARRSATSTSTATGRTCCHLPVRGSGDGGIFTTAADVTAFWTALFSGRIVSTERVAEMVQPHSDAPSHEAPLRPGVLAGRVGRRGRAARLRRRGVVPDRPRPDDEPFTSTVLSNTSEGAWPIVEHLDEPLRVVTVRSVAPVEREVTRVAPG